MANVDWFVEGVMFGGCNCDGGCPCQFEALPSHGNCTAFEALRIDRGRFADVKLDGLKTVLLCAWPGPIFKGNGEMQAIIDEGANPDQRVALATILSGGATEAAKTHWWVFHAMSSKVHEPLFRPIELDIDVAARYARLSVPHLIEASGRPIRSPATGNEHRVRIDLPNAIAIELAEIGLSTITTHGPIELDFRDRWGQFGAFRSSHAGVIHRR